MKRLVFTVTNDLNFDQRMIRICSSLQQAGYSVTLVGKKNRNSEPLIKQPFRQKRLFCFFKKGIFFYAEYNIKLFFYLLFLTFDLVCAIDLDTILPCLFISKIRNKKKVYDAHELFCEMKEVVSRRNIYMVWKKIERFALPQFQFGYTVSEPIKEVLKKDYAVNYEIIRNIPILKSLQAVEEKAHFIIYQGSINQGRSFETLIPAFKDIEIPLYLFGDGNFLEQAKNLVTQHGLEHKVLFKGKVAPRSLQEITPAALLGLTLFENNGLSNYYSLANRFFDYIHAGIPQICVDYPVYRSINERNKVAILVSDLSSATLSKTINRALSDIELLSELRTNCLEAREIYNWQTEEKKLIQYYKKIFA
jgi:glycosyltransferase involved in cell wall biosynthesis